jgi:hypothetical protein
MPCNPVSPFSPCAPVAPGMPWGPVLPSVPLTPLTPAMPFTPCTAFADTIFCTLGARRLNVIAPFARPLVLMRPEASAVPPATTTNAVSTHATVTWVRIVVEPFDDSCSRTVPHYAERRTPTGMIAGLAQKRTFLAAENLLLP